MNKTFTVVGVLFLIIGALFWLVIGYGVISEDLGQVKTLEIYWKDICYMVFFLCTGLYLLEKKK